jgi:hypothetical protein
MTAEEGHPKGTPKIIAPESYPYNDNISGGSEPLPNGPLSLRNLVRVPWSPSLRGEVSLSV